MGNPQLTRDFEQYKERLTELLSMVLNKDELSPEDACDALCILSKLPVTSLEVQAKKKLREHGETVRTDLGYVTVDAKTEARLASNFSIAFPAIFRNTQRGLVREVLDRTPSFAAVKKYNSKEELSAAGIKSRLTGHDAVTADGKYIVYSYNADATPDVEAHPY